MSTSLIDEHHYRELLDVTVPVVIRTEEEHRRLLSAASALMEKPEDEIPEEEGRFLELLSILIEEYENRAHPLPKAKPHKMLAYLLQEKTQHQQSAGQATRRCGHQVPIRRGLCAARPLRLFPATIAS